MWLCSEYSALAKEVATYRLVARKHESEMRDVQRANTKLREKVAQLENKVRTQQLTS